MLAFKPTTRYRKGDRDTEARTAHTAETVSWRHGIAEVAFTPEDQQALLESIRAGATVAFAAAERGLSFQAVYGRASWDLEFGEALDAMLAETCPAGEACGTASGVKRGGHCRDCRTAHHPPRRGAPNPPGPTRPRPSQA